MFIKPMTSISLEKLLTVPVKRPTPFEYSNLHINKNQATQPNNNKSMYLSDKDDSLKINSMKNKEIIAVQNNILEDIHPQPTTSRDQQQQDGNFVETESSQSRLEPTGTSDIQKSTIFVESITDDSEEMKQCNIDDFGVFQSEFGDELEDGDQKNNKKRVIFDLDANTHKTLSSEGRSPDDSDYELLSIGSHGIVEPQVKQLQSNFFTSLRDKTKQSCKSTNSTISKIALRSDEKKESPFMSNTSIGPFPKPRSKSNSNVLNEVSLSDFSF